MPKKASVIKKSDLQKKTSKPKSIGDALKYPFKKVSRLFHFWWLFIPIIIVYGLFIISLGFEAFVMQQISLQQEFKFGGIIWFYIVMLFVSSPLMGYIREINYNLLNKKDSEVPPFNNFWRITKSGFMFNIYTIILYLIFFVLGLLFSQIPVIGPVLQILLFIYFILVGIMLTLNYIKTDNLTEGFNLKLVHKAVFNNLGDYIVTLLKTIVVGIVLIVCSILIITLLVTIPAMQYTGYYLFADFYNRKVKTS